MKLHIHLKIWASIVCLIFSSCQSPSNINILNNSDEIKPNILLAISDDQSWCHAGAYGDEVIQTPAFDKIANTGVMFTQAYTAAPSCTPSRAGLLTGQDIWRLEEGGQLFGTLPAKFETYPDILEKNGYFVGYMKKGWGPGNFETGGRSHNPAGTKSYDNFEQFIDSVPEGTPWCFWYGSYDPHRPYEKGSGVKANIDISNIKVPEFMPDVPEVRSDIADYYFEIQRFDREFGDMLQIIEENNILENTLIVVTSDNGMPFPRAKATLYDFGVRMPLAISWKNHISGNRIVDDFISLTDLAPTFLEAAGIELPKDITGKSLLPILNSQSSGIIDSSRNFIVTGRERHAWCRKDGLGYGSRMIRTNDYLYIRNYNSQRWPAGEPLIITNEGSYGDIDASPSKSFILEHKNDPEFAHYFTLSFEKRLDEELYDCTVDPYQMNNLADSDNYKKIKNELSKKLTDYLKIKKDPRETSQNVNWDNFPYYGRHDWETNPGR